MSTPHWSQSLRRIWAPSAVLVFVSGACALVYQMVWMRELRLVFGASTAASSAVIAVFVGGLGSGGLWWGRRIEGHPAPLWVYARLELAVAGASAATPLLLCAARALYNASGGSTSLGMLGGTALRVGLTALVLGAPTWLMGGTLPAITRGIEHDSDSSRRGVAFVYAINTAGAALGCSLATFTLLEALGTRTTLWSACALNALVALGAALFARSSSDPPPTAPRLCATPANTRPAMISATAVCIASACVGFVFFLMELVWYRMLAPLLGGTVHTFGLILAVALAGIGLGSTFYTQTMRGRSVTSGAFALTCSMEALGIALPYALGDRVAIWAALLRALRGLGFGGLVFSWTVITACVVLPAAAVAGFQFPMLIALLGHGRAGVARDVGRAYAANTAGAILGALAGGFGLLQALGALGCWKLAAALLCALGLGLALRPLSGHVRRNRALVAVTAGVALACLSAEGPTAAYRHAPIGVGRVAIDSIDTTNKVTRFVNEQRHNLLWEADGVESTIGVTRADGLAFIVNGKSDGNAVGDAATQVMGGLIGAALQPVLKRALIIGLGTGSTAGWLATLPNITRVDVVELEPAIGRVARECAAVNRAVLDNPKVHIHYGDARELLAVSEDRYDLIASEPSNPYRAGIASLYTREFYAAVRQRLAPGGVFIQWLQAYAVDPALMQGVYATLGAAFAHVETWNGVRDDLLLVAADRPLIHDPRQLRDHTATEPFKTAMRVAWHTEGLEGLLGHYVANERFTRACMRSSTTEQNTDDRSPAEFRFARDLQSDESSLAALLLETVRKRGEQRPQLAHEAAVDWQRVDFENAAFALISGAAPTAPNGLTPPYRERLEVLVEWRRGQFATALHAWNNVATRDPMLVPIHIERIALGELIAYAGDPSSESTIELVLADEPTLAEMMRAVWSATHGRAAASADHLERALRRYRTDPWPLASSMARALLNLVPSLASDSGLATRYLAALSSPFAVRANETVRELAAFNLSLQLGATRSECVRVMSALEPHVPWQERVLEFRQRCYAAQRHALLPYAELDLARFRGAVGQPFDVPLDER